MKAKRGNVDSLQTPLKNFAIALRDISVVLKVNFNLPIFFFILNLSKIYPGEIFFLM